MSRTTTAYSFGGMGPTLDALNGFARTVAMMPVPAGSSYGTPYRAIAPRRMRGRFSAIVRRLVAPWRLALARRHAESQLTALDDRLLTDIGLTRGDIAAVVAGTEKDASSHLLWVAVEDRNRVIF